MFPVKMSALWRVVARCLAGYFGPLRRTLIRSRMSNPLPHHRLAKIRTISAILPRLFWIGGSTALRLFATGGK